MAIYTKTGDKGETSLANGSRVPKTDVRVEAYGTVDELNSWIGLLACKTQASSVTGIQLLSAQLSWIQNKLFNLGAELSATPGEWITATDVKQVEAWIDAMQKEVPRQKGFLLPAGSEEVCRCHVCRTVCRRAERRMIESQASEVSLQFINRLSDYLFVLARYITVIQDKQEIEWKKDISV